MPDPVTVGAQVSAVNAQVKELATPFKWLRDAYRLFKGRRKVRAFVEGDLHRMQAAELHSSFDSSRKDWLGSRMFEWEENRKGFGSFETYLTLLIDEGAVEILGAYEKDDRWTVRRYRFASWFYKYLEENPDLVERLRVTAGR